MKTALFIAIPLMLFAIFGEVIFSRFTQEISNYEKRLADNVDHIFTQNERQMLYQILQDRPRGLDDTWTESETISLVKIFNQLAQDFLPAVPAGVMYLVVEPDLAPNPEFPVLVGQSPCSVMNKVISPFVPAIFTNFI